MTALIVIGLFLFCNVSEIPSVALRYVPVRIVEYVYLTFFELLAFCRLFSN